MIKDDYYYEMNELAINCRQKWFVDVNMPIDLFNIALTKIDNLTIVLMDMGEISGASSKFDDNKVIFLNSNHSLGRQRFSLAHELYHLHEDAELITCIENSKKDNEKRADQFASLLLLPHCALNYYEQVNNIKEWNWDNIIKTEQYFQISHHAFLWRLRNLEKITYYQYQKYKNNPKKQAYKKGFSMNLYKPYTDTETTIGHYVNLANEIGEKELISIGKKDELLQDAFRSDEVW